MSELHASISTHLFRIKNFYENFNETTSPSCGNTISLVFRTNPETPNTLTNHQFPGEGTCFIGEHVSARCNTHDGSSYYIAATNAGACHS